MTDQSTCYQLTEVEDREKLFRIWQSTGNVVQSCRETGISRSTFYYWLPRFQAGGFAALAEVRSRAPKNPRRIKPELEQSILAIKDEHPSWGKARISNAIKQQHPASTMSPNTVRRVLIEANLWIR